jgi:hypothetical protein
MSYANRGLVVALATAVLQLGAPAESAFALPTESQSPEPAKTSAVEGSDFKRITLTRTAADRLDIHTVQLHQEPSGKLVAPYASVLYDLAGKAWVYTNPEPLTYLRHGIVIDFIKGEEAYLKDGPSAGTQVVTVGVPELFGIENGVGGED